jgi:hypothetical protein
MKLNNLILVAGVWIATAWFSYAFAKVDTSKLNDPTYVRENFPAILQEYQSELDIPANKAAERTLMPSLEKITSEAVLNQFMESIEATAISNASQKSVALRLAMLLGSKNTFAANLYVMRLVATGRIEDPRNAIVRLANLISDVGIQSIFDAAMSRGGTALSRSMLDGLATVALTNPKFSADVNARVVQSIQGIAAGKRLMHSCQNLR